MGKFKPGIGKPGGKGGFKSFKPFKKFTLEKKVSKKGVKPKQRNPHHKTPYKNWVGGANSRLTRKKLADGIVCWKCGQKCHFSRDGQNKGAIQMNAGLFL